MQALLEPGDTLELAIDALAHGGDGLGRVSGVVCFVAGALPGDTVKVRVYRRRSRAAWARLLAVLEPSPHRAQAPFCTGTACSSACVWHDFAYPEQAAWKRRIIAETLRRIGGVDSDVNWLEQPEYRTAYRTRAAFHGDGVSVGYYAQGTHRVIPLDACPLNHPHLNEALQKLQGPAIRGDVDVTVNPEGDEQLVFLHKDMPKVRGRFPLTNTHGDADRFRFVFDGAPVVNGTFSQSSLLLNRLLRSHVDACLASPASLLDLYCGNGNFSLHHAASCDVMGVDQAGAAIDAAAEMTSASYVRGDEQRMMEALEARPWQAILVDPPRTGAKALTDALAGARAERLVYVSCNPATLARDLRGILGGGWSLAQVTGIDMFPHTPHMETVCVLERR